MTRGTAILAIGLASLGSGACAKSEPPFVDLDAARGGDDVTVEDDVSLREPDSGVPTQDMSSAEDLGADMGRDLGTGDGGAPIGNVIASCPMNANEGGESWSGWANLQFPPVLELELGEVSEPIFGQTYAEGQTEGPGMAAGWQAQLVVGPLGANPAAQPACFRALDAEFNVDVDNNDEWWTRLRAESPGLYGMFYRFRPPAGRWLYGDLNGADDGVSADQAAVLAVGDPAGPDEVRVATLNLRCRADDWAVRFDLVLDGLAAADPHVIALQEDCAAPGGGVAQSTEIAAQLAERLDRGFTVMRAVTHQAEHAEGTFDEGIALLSAFSVDSQTTIDLPYVNFPRKAILATVRLGGDQTMTAVSTHLEFGGMNDGVRDQEAMAIVAELGTGRVIVMGDLNTEESDAAYATFDASLDDVWPVVGSGDGNTIPSSSPVRRIDYIFSAGLTPLSAQVIREVSNGVYLSDHLGVSAAFTP